MAEPIALTFRKPFAAQVAAFRLRLGHLVSTARWDDITGAAHDKAFMVAGAAKADLLADLATAVDKSIAQGTGLEEFRRDFRAIVTKHGWHDWTGEGTKAGEAWRTRVIYRTNAATSYAAGRMAQLIDGKFKYWVYRHGGSLEPRILHLGWDGVALPPNHPFWAAHAPPNGWGCSCRVFGARSEAGIRRVGGDPGKQLQDGWQRTDPGTGAPVGIDKGWDYAPGASAAEDINALTRKTVHWPYELAKAYMDALPARTKDAFAHGYRALPSLGDAARRYARAPDQARTQIRGAPYFTFGQITSAQGLRIGADLGRTVEGYDYTISRSAVRHILKAHGNAASEAARGQLAVTADSFARLGAILNSPDRIKVDGGRVIIEKTIAGVLYHAVFERLTKRRMLSLVTMWMKTA